MPWTLVTGGAKGLGAALCLELARRGHAVLVHCRHSGEAARQVAAECRKEGVSAEVVQGDFSSPQSTARFVQALQPYPEIKYLVHNVGSYLVKPASLTSPEEWDAVFQTNLHAPFAISHALLPSLIRHQGGIVSIGVAGAGLLVADTYAAAYRIAKSGLLLLTKSLAKELASVSVNVNMVSPGYLENAVDLPAQPTSLPMHRAATFDEIARVVAFLLADDSKYITGQNIEVSGGVRL